jgi:hypothetical protein
MFNFLVDAITPLAPIVPTDFITKSAAQRWFLDASSFWQAHNFLMSHQALELFALDLNYPRLLCTLFSLHTPPPPPHLQRRLNVDCYSISPDLNFILLYECKHDDSNGTKYYVYEVFSTTFYALTPNESDEVELQKILWSPASYDSNNIVNSNNNNYSQKKVLPSSKSKVKAIEKSKISQAIAFIHDYDIYYKPRIHSDLVIRVTANGELDFVMLCGDVARGTWWATRVEVFTASVKDLKPIFVKFMTFRLLPMTKTNKGSFEGPVVKEQGLVVSSSTLYSLQFIHVASELLVNKLYVVIYETFFATAICMKTNSRSQIDGNDWHQCYQTRIDIH